MKFMDDFRYLKPSFRKVGFRIFVIFIIIILLSLCALIPPYYSKLIFDEGVMGKDTGRIILYGGLALLFFFISLVLEFLSKTLFTIASNRFVVDVKENVLNRLLSMPMAFFDTKQSGYLHSRINEVNSLSAIFSPTIFTFISSIIQFAGAFTIMFGISHTITLIMLCFVPVFYLIASQMSKALKKSSRQLMEMNARTNGNLQESIGSISDLKQFNSQEKSSKKLTEQFRNVAKKSIVQSVFLSAGTQLLKFLSSAAGIIVLVISGVFIVKGELSLGDYVALAGYSGMLFVPVQLFGTFSLTIQPALVSLSRLRMIFDNKTEAEIWGKEEFRGVERKIEFKNISFAYMDEEENKTKKVLENISFSIEKGKCLSLFGRNGTGKSTLMKLLLGFYPDYSGEILLDGVELHNFDIKSVREKTGIVSQNIMLFSGTAYDNLNIAGDNLKDEELKNAWKISGCSNLFKEDMEKITIVEGGKNLSGGQKQAIAIARCLLKNPDILIFDEATAHLDADTKRLVMDSFANYFKGKTRIIISHDSELDDISDESYVLNKL